MNIKLYGKDGETPMQNLQDWEKYGKPAEKKHWKVGRSAYEVAVSWLPNNEPGVPEEFIMILQTKFEQGIIIEKIIVERKTYFSDTTNGPRNHDLLIIGKIGDNKVVIGIEGKEREPYDKKLFQKINDATSPNSKLPSRIEAFCKGILGVSYNESVKELRYQFLSGIAGVAVEVEINKADFGIFLVQQIKTENTPPKNLKSNNESYHQFIKALDLKTDDTQTGILGPFSLPGSKRVPDVSMYVGKFETFRKMEK